MVSQGSCPLQYEAAGLPICQQSVQGGQKRLAAGASHVLAVSALVSLQIHGAVSHLQATELRGLRQTQAH